MQFRQDHGVMNEAGEPALEHWYMVAFDEHGVSRCGEDWLELAPPDQAEESN